VVTDHPPRIIAVVLAAGLSRRTAPHHKLLAPDAAGRPMIERCLRALDASRVTSTLLVLGHNADAMADAVGSHQVVVNNTPEHGLASSLRAGVARAVRDGPDGILVCLGDMPLITADLIDRVIESWTTERADICQPRFGAQPGHPVLWGHSTFERLMALEGDQGARTLLHAADLRKITIPGGESCITDFDTPERLAVFSTLI